MKFKELLEKLTKAIPLDISYMEEEPYGAYNCDDLEEVNSVLYCVTPTTEVLELFKNENYDLLISHHPMITDVPQLIFHTALDCCEGGLNDMFADHLGIKNRKHFDKTLGWYGEIEPITVDELGKKVIELTRGFVGEAYAKNGYDQIVKSVVICTGLGGIVAGEALRSGADCYITGEMMCSGEESGFDAVLETGHTRSEWIGVNLFKKLLESEGVEVDGAPVGLDYYGHEYHRRQNYKYEDEEYYEQFTDEKERLYQEMLTLCLDLANLRATKTTGGAGEYVRRAKKIRDKHRNMN